MSENQSPEPVNSSTAIFSFIDASSSTNINPYEILKIVHNSDDDTLIRNLPIPITPSTDDQNCKDIPLNTQHKTWIRLFRPIQLQDDNFSATNKLPVIIYYHGGGFILFSAASAMFHDFCKSIANHLSALIVSIEYRLAPENRLPAAYDDAIEAINWVRKQALESINGEPWLRDYADFSKSFIMGCSAGGNIAYHACLRALELNLEPVKINGLILHQPFIGGLERTESEIQLKNDRILPCPVTDLMWELALPIGASRDHVYCNPMVEINDGSTVNGGNKVELLRRCLVVGCDGDPLIDRQVELVKMLDGKGVKVETWMEKGGFHGMAFFDPKIAEILFGKLKDFIFSVISGAAK